MQPGAQQRGPAIGKCRSSACSRSASTGVFGGGSKRAPYQDAAACKLLAASVQLTADANGLGANGYTYTAQAQVTIQDNASHLSPHFRHDVIAVINTGLNNPSQAAVQRLQADCVWFGVYRPVWPAAPTG